jgi:UDP:flavonoid glycosyltransferase YjiC (YdhE family)
LAFGVPLVLLPMGADQPQNADRCRALGVARVLDPVSATVPAIRAAVSDVLHHNSYHRSAQEMRQEIALLPTSTDAAEWVVALAHGRAAPPAG